MQEPARRERRAKTRAKTGPHSFCYNPVPPPPPGLAHQVTSYAGRASALDDGHHLGATPPSAGAAPAALRAPSARTAKRRHLLAAARLPWGA
eukprot:scaffold947_cov375-Prasinococcus_capsulatus_cf.AAC.20